MRIKNLDLLIEKTRDDRQALLSKNNELQATLQDAPRPTFPSILLPATPRLHCLRSPCHDPGGETLHN